MNVRLVGYKYVAPTELQTSAPFAWFS